MIDQPDLPAPQRTYRRPPGSGTAARFGALGVVGFEIDPDVMLFDGLGLADPVAARTPPVAGARPGHAHDLAPGWVLARGRAEEVDDASTAAARRALGCGDLGRYLHDISARMTPGRFVANLVHAPANTRLRVPADPVDAVARSCP